jgi:hypothetical protein
MSVCVCVRCQTCNPKARTHTRTRTRTRTRTHLCDGHVAELSQSRPVGKCGPDAGLALRRARCRPVQRKHVPALQRHKIREVLRPAALQTVD